MTAAHPGSEAEALGRLTRFVAEERAGAAKTGTRIIPAAACAGLTEDVAALLAHIAQAEERHRTFREEAEKERKAHHAEALETIAVWRARAEKAERDAVLFKGSWDSCTSAWLKEQAECERLRADLRPLLDIADSHPHIGPSMRQAIERARAALSVGDGKETKP